MFPTWVSSSSAVTKILTKLISAVIVLDHFVLDNLYRRFFDNISRKAHRRWEKESAAEESVAPENVGPGEDRRTGFGCIVVGKTRRQKPSGESDFENYPNLVAERAEPKAAPGSVFWNRARGGGVSCGGRRLGNFELGNFLVKSSA